MLENRMHINAAMKVFCRYLLGNLDLIRQHVAGRYGLRIIEERLYVQILEHQEGKLDSYVFENVLWISSLSTIENKNEVVCIIWAKT